MIGFDERARFSAHTDWMQRAVTGHREFTRSMLLKRTETGNEETKTESCPEIFINKEKKTRLSRLNIFFPSVFLRSFLRTANRRFGFNFISPRWRRSLAKIGKLRTDENYEITIRSNVRETKIENWSKNNERATTAAFSIIFFSMQEVDQRIDSQQLSDEETENNWNLTEKIK